MPTSARPHPSLNAMLLCDLTIREHGTGKMSLIGIFENISAARFPVVHRALTVYAKLADAEGDYAIRLELLRLDDSHMVAQGTPEQLQQSDHPLVRKFLGGADE